MVRKHRLAERLLTDVIGLAWHKVHVEASRWEHVISDEVEERLVPLLNNPTTCPHGNPIPGTHAPRRDLVQPCGTTGHVRLLRLWRYQAVRLRRRCPVVPLEVVPEQVELDLEALTYLGEHGFLPGTEAQVRDKAPDGTLALQLDGTIALGSDLAQQLYVERV